MRSPVSSAASAQCIAQRARQGKEGRMKSRIVVAQSLHVAFGEAFFDVVREQRGRIERIARDRHQPLGAVQRHMRGQRIDDREARAQVVEQRGDLRAAWNSGEPRCIEIAPHGVRIRLSCA